MSKIRLPAKIENLKELIQFVSDFARGEGFTQRRIRELELATEEALVNVFSYAYPEGNTGDVEVRCRTSDDTELFVEISDTGKPFDILSFSKPDLTSNLSDRKIGGLGIYLIRKMVDDVRCHRDGERNILTFVFRKS